MMAWMTRCVRVLLVTSAALLLAACAGPGGGGTTSGNGPASGSGAPAGGGGTSSADVFPLTLERRGGIAGFDETMRVEADGTVSFSRHGGETTRCRLHPRLLDAVADGAQQVDWPGLGAPSTTPRYADELVVVVTSPRGSARLDAAAARALTKPLTRVLVDVSRPAGEQKLCTPLE